MSKICILVPTDFSSVAETALDHACQLAKKINAKVVLMHVVGKQSDADDKKGMVEKEAAKALEKYGPIDISGIVRVGNIFDDIGDAASEMKAHFIFMGTHGVKGMQHITGSYALKVITNSPVPFIVVQDKKWEQGYKNIVVPLDLSKETKQKLKYVVELAELFGSQIHLIIPQESDEYLVNTLKRNLQFSKKYLAEHKVAHTVTLAEDGNFAKQVIKFATSKNADLISIMNIKGNMVNLFEGASKQMILTNDPQIPVLCVNPKDTSVSFWGS